MRRKLLIGGAVALVIMLVVGGGLYRRAKGAPAEKVMVHQAMTGDLALSVEAEGVVEPVEQVEVRAAVSGSLVRVDAEDGDAVERGQLLAAYDAADLALQLRRAESEVAAARSRVAQLEARLGLDRRLRQEELDRVEALFRQGQAAREDVDLARQALANAGQADALNEQLAAARAALAAAEAAYRQTVEASRSGQVLSPIRGVILSREGTRVGVVAKGTVLFVLADLSRVIVKAKVDEVDIGSVVLGQEVEVATSAYPDEVFRGKVTRIAPQARKEASLSGQSNVITFDVDVEVDNRDVRLRPGMSVDTRIVVEKRHGVVAAPAEAVVERGGRQGVFVVGPESVVRFRPVQAGLANQTQVELSGIKGGEELVTGPAEVLKKLQDGQRVRSETIDSAKGE